MDFLLYWLDVIELWFSMVVAVAIGLYVGLYGPMLRSWYRKRTRCDQEKKIEVEELLRQSKKDQPPEMRRPARIKLLKLATKTYGMLILILAGVVGFFWSLKAWDERQLRSLWTETIRVHDELKEGLFFKTIRKPDSPICPQEAKTNDDREACVQHHEETIAILRQEILCRDRASIATDQTLGDDSTRIRIGRWTYSACMWEAGWRTDQCVKGEEGCVEVFFFESPCLSAKRRWLEDGRNTYTIKRCQSFPPEPFSPTLSSTQ